MKIINRDWYYFHDLHGCLVIFLLAFVICESRRGHFRVCDLLTALYILLGVE